MAAMGLLALALWFVGVMAVMAWRFASGELAARERYDINMTSSPVPVEARRHRPAARR